MSSVSAKRSINNRLRRSSNVATMSDNSERRRRPSKNEYHQRRSLRTRSAKSRQSIGQQNLAPSNTTQYLISDRRVADDIIIDVNSSLSLSQRQTEHEEFMERQFDNDFNRELELMHDAIDPTRSSERRHLRSASRGPGVPFAGVQISKTDLVFDYLHLQSSVRRLHALIQSKMHNDGIEEKADTSNDYDTINELHSHIRQLRFINRRLSSALNKARKLTHEAAGQEFDQLPSIEWAVRIANRALRDAAQIAPVINNATLPFGDEHNL